MDAINKLISTTLQSKPLTHFRLKNLSAIAQTSEEDIGNINAKLLRGQTLFKEDLALWMGLTLRHQIPSDYEEWRLILRSHWERGVEMLAKVSDEEDDWLLVVKSCLPN